MTLTPSQIEKMKPEDRELAELCEKATPGPWLTRTVPADVPSGKWYEAFYRVDKIGYPLLGTERVGGKQWKHDVDLAAAARTALPRLLGEKVELEELCEKFRKWANCGGVSVGWKCSWPKELGHEIFGAGHANGDGTYLCEFHWFESRIASLEEQKARLERDIKRGIREVPLPEPKDYYKCFGCKQVFLDDASAEAHFGKPKERKRPTCEAALAGLSPADRETK